MKRVDRRSLLGAATLWVAALPVSLATSQTAHAQAPSLAPGKVQRIGVLGPDVSDGQGPVWQAFVDELARRGHVQGRNLVIDKRLGEGDRPELVDKLAAELVALHPDVIYAARGTLSALAAKRATSSIPIVFYSSGDPVGLGLVASLARPGGNLTGSSVQGFDIIARAIQLLGDTLGKVRRIAYLAPAGMRNMPWFAALDATLTTSARTLGASIVYFDVASVDQLDAMIERMVREHVDAVIVADFPLFRPHMSRIAALFIRHKLPAYGNAYDGFLMHYGEQRVKLAHMAAAYVDRILRGARPADLPVEQLSTFEFVINQTTAKALGITIPQTVLVRADEVVQ